MNQSLVSARGLSRRSRVIALLFLALAATSARGQDAAEFALAPGSNPTSITPGPDGNLWVAECDGDRIARVTAAGVVTEFPVPGTGPCSIAKGGDGALWFVETKTNRIGRITTAGAVTELDIPPADLQFGVPNAIGAAANGSLWLGFRAFGVDTVTGGVAAVTATGVGPVIGSGAISSITTGPDGAAWATGLISGPPGPGASYLCRIDAEGSVRTFFVEEGPGWPVIIAKSLTAGADGNLWFTADPDGMAISGAVGRMTPGGDWQLFRFPIQPSDMRGIAAGADGRLWVADAGRNAVLGVTPDGGFMDFSPHIPTANAGLTGVAVAADGAVWFTEASAGKVGRFVPSPSSGVSAVTMTIPAIASIVGKRGQAFQSDVWMQNVSNKPVLLTTLFRCQAPFVCPRDPLPIPLAPGQTFHGEDFAARMGGPGTAGTLLISYPADRGPVLISSIVFTSPNSGGGRLATSVPALPSSAAQYQTVFLGLPGPANGARTNAGVYNATAAAANVTFTLRGTTGSWAVTLPADPGVPVQLNDVAEATGAPLTEELLTLEITADQPVFGYAFSIDDTSGSPTALVPVDLRIHR